MPNPDETVKARFIPADKTSTFSYSTPVPQEADFTGRIKYGDVVNVRREEAEQRTDFEVVGEEATTTSPPPEAPPAALVEPGESVVAPPPASPTPDATAEGTN